MNKYRCLVCGQRLGAPITHPKTFEMRTVCRYCLCVYRVTSVDIEGPNLVAEIELLENSSAAP